MYAVKGVMQNFKELVILHASDVHIASHRIYQLRSWLKRSKQIVDVVLLSGDLADMPLELCYTAPPDEIQAQHILLEKILEEFLPLDCKVYYIPGNHDAITTFNTESHSTDSSPCNMHKRGVVIAPNLQLLGLGGSVPGFRQGEKVWDGFPYRTDQEYSKDLSKLLEPVFEGSKLKESDAIILMTHVGPHHSNTTISHVDPQSPIHSGSSSLYTCLCKEELVGVSSVVYSNVLSNWQQKHVILNVHGHTHEAMGQATLGSTTVINPGALMDGYFGLYTLRETGQAPGWRLTSACLHRLCDED